MDEDPELLDAYAEIETPSSLDGESHESYYSYNPNLFCDKDHFKSCLVIADPVPGDSALYLLNPSSMAADGEWEAWFFANWVPGVERYPSFGHLLQAQYRLFQINDLKLELPQITGPYPGPYAPEAPRRQAEPIGAPAVRSRRATLEELISDLSSPTQKARRDAAKILFRIFKPHDPSDTRPELIPALSQILSSSEDPIARAAAAAMLGSYGNEDAITPLLNGLHDQDRDVVITLFTALFYLAIYYHPTVISDELLKYLETSPAPRFLEGAWNIINEVKDPRFLPHARRLLTSDLHRVPHRAADFVRQVAQNPADEFLPLLSHQEPHVQVTALIGLRLLNYTPAVPAIRSLATMGDPEVRFQAAYTLRHLGEQMTLPPEVEAVANELMAKRQIAAARKFWTS